MRIQVGSLVIEDELMGNVVLYRSHHPKDRFMIERADLEDLVILVKKLKKEKRL